MWYTIAIASISERKYLHIGICFVTTQSVVWCSCHQRSATCHTSHHTVSRSNPTSSQEASARVLGGGPCVTSGAGYNDVRSCPGSLDRAISWLWPGTSGARQPEWSQSRARVEPIRARFYSANLIFPPAPRPLGHKRGCSVENNSACSLWFGSNVKLSDLIAACCVTGSLYHWLSTTVIGSVPTYTRLLNRYIY